MPHKRKIVESFSESEDEPIEVKKKIKLTNIKSEKQEKKAKKRVKNSNFVFTVNLNVRIGPYEQKLEGFCKKYEKCWDDIYSNLGEYIEFQQEGAEWTPEYVRKAQTQCFIERGEKYDQIHSHNFVGISHYSKIHLDRQKIKEKICGDMGLKNIYISQIKVLRKSTEADLENWIEYAQKNYKPKDDE